MEFKGTLLIDASPALLSVLNKFADVLNMPACEPQKTKRIRRAVVDNPLPDPVKETVPEPETDPISEEPSTPEPENTSGSEGLENVTIEAVRALMAQKAKINREAVKQALTECGASKIGELPEEKYSEFYNKLLAL